MKYLPRIFTLLLCLLIFAGSVAAQSLKEYYLTLPLNKKSLEETLHFTPIAMPDNIKEIVDKIEYWDMDYQWVQTSEGQILFLNTPDYNEFWHNTIQFIPKSDHGTLHRTAKGSTLHHSQYDYTTRFTPVAYDGVRLLVLFDNEWNEEYARKNFPNIKWSLVILTPVDEKNFLKRIEIIPHPEASSEAAVVHNIPPREIVQKIGLRPLPVDEKFYFCEEEKDDGCKKNYRKNIIFSTPNIRDTLYRVRYWRPDAAGYAKWENGKVVFDQPMYGGDLLEKMRLYEFDATKPYVILHSIPYSWSPTTHCEIKCELDRFTVSAYDGEKIIFSNSINDDFEERFTLSYFIPASREEVEQLMIHKNRKPPILSGYKRLNFKSLPHPACQPLTAKPIGKIELQQMESRLQRK